MDDLPATLPGSPTFDSAGFGGVMNELKTRSTDARGSHQQSLLAFGRRTNAQPSLHVLMQDAVALLGEVLGGDMGSVGEVKGDRFELTVFAWNGDGKTSAGQVHVYPLAEVNSMAAYALQSGSPVVSPDLRAERRFHDAFLQHMGLAAGLAVPLHVNGRPFGLLGICFKAPREFTLDDVTFAETIAHLLSVSISRIQLEQRLEEANAFKSSVLEMVDTMVLTLDTEGRVLDMNRACQRTTKYDLADVRDRPFWQTLAAPEESDLMRIIFQGSLRSQIPSDFEGLLLAKDGRRWKVSWSIKVLSSGHVQTVLMFGRGQTAHAETPNESKPFNRQAAQTTGAPADTVPRPEEPNKDRSRPGALGDNYESPFQLTDAEAPPVQRRRSPRRSYRYRQWMAPVYGNVLPVEGEFTEANCWDISAGGISFFLDCLPNFETLVVALGRPPALSYFSARVMRVARVEQEGADHYLIGCAFLGRVHLPKTRLAAK